MLLAVRDLLVRQRTQLLNAQLVNVLGGHAAEFGLVAPIGGKIIWAMMTRGEAYRQTAPAKA